MKTETEIAKENIKKIKELDKKYNKYNEKCIEYFKKRNSEQFNLYMKKLSEINDAFIGIEILIEQHKQTCQRFLEFLDNINVFKGSKHPIDRGVHKITEEKIQDLKTAIKLYEKEGI